jgi:hypothetical protein
MEKVTELTNRVEELTASNSAKEALIAGYKASSKPVKVQAKSAPKEQEAQEDKGISEKIKNIQNIKIK